MKLKLVIAITGALLLAMSLGAPIAASVTLHVDDDGIQWPGAYTSIGAAVAAASDGDTIIVHEGTYVENVSVPVSVTLQAAAGEERPTVDGGSSGRGFDITADDVILEGFDVSATGGDVILVFDADGVIVRDNKVTGGGPYVTWGNPPAWAGISVLISDNVTIERNSSRQSTGFGVFLGSASNCIVVDNSVVDSQYAGIVLTDWIVGTTAHGPCYDNLVEGNKVRSSGNPDWVLDDGIRLDTGAHANVVKANKVNASVRDGIRADSSTYDNDIEYNTIRGSGIGFSGGVDARDLSTGDGTAGTDNYWSGNSGRTSIPTGLCDM